MVESATRWENLGSLYMSVEQSCHFSSGISTSRLLSEKEKQIHLHIVHTTVIRVSIFCKTYILTVIEFDICTEVASITNPKIQDDQKVQISKSEFQISESGKAISVCPLNKYLHFSLCLESNFLKGVAIGRNVGKTPNGGVQRLLLT